MLLVYCNLHAAEADNPAALARIQTDFRRVLAAARPGLALPF